ncbi:hypothetical protein Tco_1238538 [Tanacetum coccineum]
MVLELEKAIDMHQQIDPILTKKSRSGKRGKESSTFKVIKLFKIGTVQKKKLIKEDASKHGGICNAKLISKEDDFECSGFDLLGMKMSETSKEKSIVFEDVEESPKEQREKDKSLPPQRMQEEQEMTEQQKSINSGDKLKS